MTGAPVIAALGNACGKLEGRDRHARKPYSTACRIIWSILTGDVRASGPRAQRTRAPLPHHQRLPRRAVMDPGGQNCYAVRRKETPVRFTGLICRTIAICG